MTESPLLQEEVDARGDLISLCSRRQSSFKTPTDHYHRRIVRQHHPIVNRPVGRYAAYAYIIIRNAFGVASNAYFAAVAGLRSTRGPICGDEAPSFGLGQFTQLNRLLQTAGWKDSTHRLISVIDI
jgi:hypothetical protein